MTRSGPPERPCPPAVAVRAGNAPPFRRARAAAAALVLCGLLAGCDPPPASVVAGTGTPAEFSVAAVNVRESCLPAGEPLVVRFSRPLDAASAGPRTVQVSGARRRRLSAASFGLEGDTIRVPADVLATLAAGEPVEVRIEGGASPCALRSADGEPLPERWLLVFRIGSPGEVDGVGPSLAGTRPADGESEVPGGACVELRFSEPVSLPPEAVSVRVDGEEVPVRVRASSDRRRAVVRPERPFPPGAAVTLDLHRCVTDDAGNPLDAGSRGTLGFRVRASGEQAIEEEFASDEFLDRPATDAAWDEVSDPGFLVAGCGPRPHAALDTDVAGDLGDRASVRFQMLFRAGEAAGGAASGLRVRFSGGDGAAPLLAAWIDGGPIESEFLAPSFQANRAVAEVTTLAEFAEPLPWEADGTGGSWVDVPFTVPLDLDAGRSVLLDVTLAPEPGVRVAAVTDAVGRTLVRGGGRDPASPAADLLVTGGPSSARSLWYDSGVEGPQWRSARIDGTGAALVEFQAAPPDASGRPDAAHASPWSADLAALPEWRFVRFRVRFEDPGVGAAPRLDRIALPYGVRTAPRDR